MSIDFANFETLTKEAVLTFGNPETRLERDNKKVGKKIKGNVPLSLREIT